MMDKDSKELQVKPKQEVSTAAEQTRPGLVFTPNVDIFETDRELTLLADLPGFYAKERGRSPGKDLLYEVILSPQEARQGGLFPITVPVIEPCSQCGTSHYKNNN